MQTKKTKIFISKSLDDLNLLPDYCEQNSLLLTAHSFLSFSEVDFTIDSGFDVVFFSSPRSAYYFLTKVKLNKHIEIAVAGETTKIMVESFGYPVSFFPEKAVIFAQVRWFLRIGLKTNRFYFQPLTFH